MQKTEKPKMQVALEKRGSDIKAAASKFKEITTVKQYDAAVATLKLIKGAVKEITEWCDPDIKRWKEGHTFALKRKKDLTTPLTDAERLLKSSISRFKTAQERAAAEARAKAETEARAAAEAERKAEAEALRAEGEDDLAEIVEEMPVKAEVIVDSVMPVKKTDGVSTRAHVVIEVIDKKAAIAYILENWAHLNHLAEINTKELRKLGIAQRENFELPGCKCTIEKRLSVR